jgi:uncharacterized protein YicC (UPF0701 family)
MQNLFLLILNWQKPISNHWRSVKGIESRSIEYIKHTGKITRSNNPTSETLTDEEWKAFQKVILLAIDDLNIHRDDEGKSLKKICSPCHNILAQLEEVQKLEPNANRSSAMI